MSFFIIPLSAGYGFEFDVYHQINMHIDIKEKNQTANHLLKINLGFIGNENYEKRKNYLNNCFSYNCTSFGINFKINLPISG